MANLEYFIQQVSHVGENIESRINSREWIIKYSENTKGSNGIAVLSGMGALAYLVSVTIGGGSYTDLMPGWLSTIVGGLLVIFLIINLGFFLFTSLFVLESFINLKAARFEIPPKLEFNTLFIIRIISFIVFIVVFFSATLSLSIGISEGLLDGIALTIVVLITAGFLALALLDTVRLAAQGSLIEIPVAIFIFVLTSMICLNGFRDSQKSALIADSQYCFWLRSAVNTNTFTTAHQYNAALDIFKTMKPCKNLIEKGINLESLSVTR